MGITRVAPTEKFHIKGPGWRSPVGGSMAPVWIYSPPHSSDNKKSCSVRRKHLQRELQIITRASKILQVWVFSSTSLYVMPTKFVWSIKKFLYETSIFTCENVYHTAAKIVKIVYYLVTTWLTLIKWSPFDSKFNVCLSTMWTTFQHVPIGSMPKLWLP